MRKPSFLSSDWPVLTPSWPEVLQQLPATHPLTSVTQAGQPSSVSLRWCPSIMVTSRFLESYSHKEDLQLSLPECCSSHSSKGFQTTSDKSPSQIHPEWILFLRPNADEITLGLEVRGWIVNTVAEDPTLSPTILSSLRVTAVPCTLSISECSIITNTLNWFW